MMSSWRGCHLHPQEFSMQSHRYPDLQITRYNFMKSIHGVVLYFIRHVDANLLSLYLTSVSHCCYLFLCRGV